MHGWATRYLHHQSSEEPKRYPRHESAADVVGFRSCFIVNDIHVHRCRTEVLFQAILLFRLRYTESVAGPRKRPRETCCLGRLTAGGRPLLLKDLEVLIHIERRWQALQEL